MHKWAWLPFTYNWKTALSWLAFRIMNKSPRRLNSVNNVQDKSFETWCLLSLGTQFSILIFVCICVWETKRANWVIFPFIMWSYLLYTNYSLTHMYTHTHTHTHTCNWFPWQQQKGTKNLILWRASRFLAVFICFSFQMTFMWLYLA